jgi:hypothetical protein
MPRLMTAVWAALTLLAAARASGDGGVVRQQQADGPFLVTVFTAPTPLRAGPVDISVLVQKRNSNEPVLDAAVHVTLISTEPGAAIRSAATRQLATNKLLYAAPLNVPSAGTWDLRVVVRRGQDTAAVGCQIGVAAALPPLLAHWPYLALPPVVVLVFALHQWLRSRSIKAS